jgi:hypothetical protein
MNRFFNRRQMLWSVGGGLGGLALTHLLMAQEQQQPHPRPEFNGGLHHPAKIKRVIQLFMNGGASPADTFDYKPVLEQQHGKAFDPGAGKMVESVTGSPGFKVMKSPFAFKQYGESGRWVSSVFPHLSKQVDDLTFLMSMVSKTNVHGPASYLMNTGFILPGFPCMGSWLSYGLGKLTDNLPTFVVLPDARGLPYNNLGNFSSGFLPVSHQGTVVKLAKDEPPIRYLFPSKQAKFITSESERDSQQLLKDLNIAHQQRSSEDSRLEARIQSYELAARMQSNAPEAFDASKESPATQKLYGLDQPATEPFGRQCLTAKRLIERGVRFVQVWSGAGGPAKNWDNHANIEKELTPMALATDQPIAALLHDLKTSGLLADTLVIWTTEFGRMPFSQGSAGRDHNGGTFVSWLAGAGLQPGIAHGESDEWAWKAQVPITVHDLHATILHLMGIDHERLTVRFGGANRRLTDVHGTVISEILS